MESLVEVRNLRAYYMLRGGKIAVKAVDNITMDIKEGEVLGIVGESGCGKSTFARCIMIDFTPPLRKIGGKIIMDGHDLTSLSMEELRKNVWGRLISMIPQSALNALPPVRKIGDFIYDVALYRLGIRDKEKVQELAQERFEDVKLAPYVLNMYPHELSGGMKQRVAIAIATLLKPKLLIADEPTSALDVVTQKAILRTLLDLKKGGIISSIMFITHDIAILRQIADRIGVMYAGKLVEIGSVDQILYNPLHPYTKALINSVVTPEPEIRKRGITYIPGSPPELINPPPGCRFHPRCPYVKDVCKIREPEMVTVEPGHLVACHLYSQEEGRS